MRRDGKCAAVTSNEDAVASTLVTPVNPVLFSHALEMGDLPVERIASHGSQKLGRSIHFWMIPPVTSLCKLAKHEFEA